jgi:hypothetical protein
LTTSVPKPSFGPAGFIAPLQSVIRAAIKADINAAFGGNLNPDDTTPQGQLAVSIAAITGYANDLFLAITNQVDPAYADGRMQDAIARIYFLTRNPAEPTVVQASCGGLAGTIIPTGALARAANGNTYVCAAGGTIPAGGVVTLSFSCTTPGPVSCAPNSLTTIYRAIPGWDTITNPATGVLGRNVESRNEFETRRSLSVALNALGTVPAIRASVLAVPNVLDAYVTDNSTNAVVTVGGVALAANSLYVAVAGGVLGDVAKAIWRKKMPGCAYTGTTTVSIVDDNSGYAVPYPSYNITFTVPTPVAIKFAISIANSPGVPADALSRVQTVIIAAFAGSDGGPRARIGGAIFASRFYAGVAQLGAWAQIVSIKIGTTTATLDEVIVNINQVPTVAPADISVTLV